MSVRENEGDATSQQYFGSPPWENPDSLEYYYLEEDYSPERIAEEVCNNDVSADVVRANLRQYGLLKAWDDPEWLATAHGDDGHSTHVIAEEILDGAVSSETIRNRLHEFDLLDDYAGYGVDGDVLETARAAFEDVPEGDDSYQQFTECGRDA